MEYVIENEENKCPWCDCTHNKILKVNTFKLYPDNKKIKIWNFQKEIRIRNESFSIPVRVVEDFLSDRLEEELFKIKLNDSGVVICYFNEEFDFRIEDDKNNKKLFEKINIENKSTVHLICNKKNNQFIKNILIEVEII